MTIEDQIHDFYQTHKDAEIMQPTDRFTNKPASNVAGALSWFLLEYPVWAAGCQDADDEELYSQRLQMHMHVLQRGVTQWRGVTKSAAEIEAQAAAEREEEEAEALRLEQVAAAQEASKAKKIRLQQPSLLSTKAAELKLNRRRTAQVSMLIRESLERTFFHEVVKGLESHGMLPSEAIDDALEIFGDRIGYSGAVFTFNTDDFHLDDLELR